MYVKLIISSNEILNLNMFCFFSYCGLWNILLGFALSILLTIIWTFFLFKFFYKPKLNIENPEFENNLIKFKVVNKGKSRIVKIKVEACIVHLDPVLNITTTYHYQFFDNEFVMLPTEKENNGMDIHERCFKIYSFSQQAIFEDPNLENETLVNRLTSENYLRIRIHASHENSGFGKAFEAMFIFDGKIFRRFY